MFREIREWVHLALLYGLLYSTALVVLVLGIANISNTPTHAETIIYKTKEVVKEVVRNPEVVSLEQVCNRIEGCEVFPEAQDMKDYCPTCIEIWR